jgi:hypothetical protein
MTSFVGFSQKGTDTSHNKKDSLISFTVPVARQIVKDLLRGDSCAAILENTKQELSQVYDKVDLQDSVINAMKTKEGNYEKTIKLQNDKYEVLDKHTREVELQLAGANVTKGLYKYGLFGSIGILLVSLFLHK